MVNKYLKRKQNQNKMDYSKVYEIALDSSFFPPAAFKGAQRWKYV